MVTEKELEKIPKTWPKDTAMLSTCFKTMVMQMRSHLTELKGKFEDFATSVNELVHSENDMRSQVEAFKNSVSFA